MKISNFNNEYLTPLFAKIFQEEKTCLLMGNFSIRLWNTDTNRNFSDILSPNFLTPYILQPTRLAEISKTFIDNIILYSIEFNTFPGNLTLQMLDHLPQFLIQKDFYHKTFINSNNVFKRNYRFFIHDENKNDLKDNIPWDNILSSNNISASLAFDLVFFYDYYFCKNL